MIIPREILNRDDVSVHAKLVYGLLLYYREFHHGEFPTHRNLGFDLGVPKSTVQRKMAELEHLGLLERYAPVGQGRRIAYRLRKDN